MIVNFINKAHKGSSKIRLIENVTNILCTCPTLDSHQWSTTVARLVSKEQKQTLSFNLD